MTNAENQFGNMECIFLVNLSKDIKNVNKIPEAKAIRFVEKNPRIKGSTEMIEGKFLSIISLNLHE